MGRISSQDQVAASLGAGVSRACARQGASFRLHLIAMLLAALLPACLAVAVAVRKDVDEYRTAFREELEATARAVALAVDVELHARLGLASALAAMATNGAVLTLDDRLRTVAERLGTGVIINGPPPELRELANTHRPAGAASTEGRPGADPAPAGPRIFAEGRPLIGAGWIGPRGAKWVAGAYAPVTVDGVVVAALGVGLDLPRLRQLLADKTLRGQAAALLADPAGIILAHSDGSPERIGQTLPGWLRRALPREESGILFEPFNGAQARIHAFARPTYAPDWLVVISKPLENYLNGWRGPGAPLIVGALIALLGGAVLALLLARRCLQPVMALTEQAAAITVGRPHDPAPPSSAVSEFALLGAALSAAHAALRHEAAAARHERELLQSLIDGSPDFISVKGLDDRTILANATADAFFHLSPGGLIGLRCCELVPEPLAERVRRHDQAALRAGRAISEEYTLDEFGGRSLMITKVPWRDPSRRDVAGIITLIHDITEQRRTEAQLRRAEDEMQRLGRRATAIVLASGLAHELNQPLTAATNYLRAAQRLAGTEAGFAPLPLLREAVRGAAEQTLRAGEIIRRLRDFMARRQGAAAPEPLAPVVDEGVRLALAGLTSNTFRHRVEIAPDVARARVDRLTVQQVLVNLVRNAVEAMQGLAQQELTITASRRGAEDSDWVDIRVADTGPGLPPEVAERLFEPFVSTKPDGMGVGLAICQRIAEASGGNITISTVEGSSGIAVTLSLPLVEA